MRLFLQSIFIFSIVAFTNAQTSKVHVISIDGAINPASADYIHEEIERAAADHAECLILQLNTPGGLLKSTRVIVSEILNAPLPIIVYVSPSGSQAASAGVFVTLSAHIAVMAPGTNIGAAHPVTLGEQQDSVMMGKVTNDAAAFIRTISEKRNRNVSWAEDAVRKSLSITETEALKSNVIDAVAASIPDVLQKIDGRKIQLATREQILRTKDATIVTIEKSFQQKILDLLSDPNIAYIFMMLGFYGLLFELYNPGSILPGIVGVISLVIAFYSLHTLPINYAGLALIIFAIILFILDLKLASHGILTVGGVVSLMMGSVMLIRHGPGFDVLAISWSVILIVVVITTAFFAFAIGMGVRAQRRKPATGSRAIIGEIGEAITDLRPDGQIRIHGEIWSAESVDGTLKKGCKVRAVEIENLKLKVRKS
ncbi:MAG: nodulation protein NfeD [Ignavibacteria bacterium]|nr:nodulation protein NfeD [Ignavibacteria bacterium]